ncbi:hypothetical protein [Crenobacter cavernae]|uniref:Phage holin T7 family, holin superfamily II n=1 Tax=Crenobacter cavernae TaxID=2290923 RepID=A0ABY0FEQ8_9NEIS|nr:hypothetical protein [Crenobacter cavernae]RXZ42720.1 hypothetical protein EBB06_12575 [Crenobacter cavernae]
MNKAHEAAKAAPLMAASEAARAAPPVAVSAASLAGYSLADWVSALTLLYVALQVGLLMPRYWRLFLNWRRERVALKGESECRRT